MKTMKIGKTIIALAAACFAGGFLETRGQETLTVQYTKEDGSSHTRLVENDIEVMFFTGLKSITLPEGFTNLRVLNANNGSLTNISLPESLTNLTSLSIWNNDLTSFTLPEELSNLETLGIRNNQLTNLSLPEDLSNLALLNLSGNQLTSLLLPKGLVNLRSLIISTNPLTSLKLPEDLAKNADEEFPLDTDNGWFDETFLPGGFRLSSSSNLERLSVHYEMREFSISQRLENEDANRRYAHAIIPAAKELIKNESPDSDGFFKVDLETYSEHEISVFGSVLVEVYGAPPTIKMIRMEDGHLEIVWKDCILQRSPTINGPWVEAAFIGEFRSLLFPSQRRPSEFFRVKPLKP